MKYGNIQAYFGKITALEDSAQGISVQYGGPGNNVLECSVGAEYEWLGPDLIVYAHAKGAAP